MNAPITCLLLWMSIVAGGASTTGGWTLRIQNQVECRKPGRYKRCSETLGAFVETVPPESYNDVPEELLSCCVLQMEKMHSPRSRRSRHKSTYDKMVPFTDATKQNRINLYDLLTSAPLLEGLSEAGQRACGKLHRATNPPPRDCIEAPASPPCESIGHQNMQAYLRLLEQGIASTPPIHQAQCGLIHRMSVHLYDLLFLLDILGLPSPGSPLPFKSLEEAFRRFFQYPLQGVQDSLEAEGKIKAKAPTEGSEPRTTSPPVLVGTPMTLGPQAVDKTQAVNETLFLTLKKLRRIVRRKRPSDRAELAPISVRPTDSDVVHSQTVRRIFFNGSRHPAVAVVFNLLFQAWFRREEFFESRGHPRRLFPSVTQILLGSSQQRQVLASALCGFTLGSLLRQPRIPKTMWSAPLEFWRTPTRLVGLAKFSCDVLRLSMRALDLAETSGTKLVNELMDVLSRADRKHTVHLERNVTAATNLRRLCFALSRGFDRHTVSSLVKCRLEDTVLGEESRYSSSSTEGARQRLTAGATDADVASGSTQQANETTSSEEASSSTVELSSKAQLLHRAAFRASIKDGPSETPRSGGNQDSLLEAYVGAVQGRESAGLEDETILRASEYFNWLQFQSGGRLLAPAVAEVFSMDLGSWWEHMLDYDMRSFSNMDTTIKKAAIACKKAARVQFPETAEVDCNKTPSPKYWKAACAPRLTAFSCKHSGALCSLLDTTNVADVLKRAAAADLGAKRPKTKNGRPYVVFTGTPGAVALADKASAYGPAYLRLFQFCSCSTFVNKELLEGSDHVSTWSSSLAIREVGKGKRRWFGALLPASFRRLRRWFQRRRYRPAMTQFLKENLSARAKAILLTAVRVVAHPVAFLMINQRSPYLSVRTGRRQGKGGYVGEMDEIISAWSKQGLPDSLLDKMRNDVELKPADFTGLNILETPIPSKESFWGLTKETLIRRVEGVLFQPQSRTLMRAGCLFPSQSSAVLAALADSLTLLRSTPADNLHIIGAVVNPEKASTWKPGLLSRIWTRLKRAAKSLIRLPPWKAQHMVYVGVTVDANAVSRLTEEAALLFNRFKQVFKSRVAFKEAIYRWLQTTQQRFQDVRRGVQSVRKTW